MLWLQEAGVYLFPPHAVSFSYGDCVNIAVFTGSVFVSNWLFLVGFKFMYGHNLTHQLV